MSQCVVVMLSDDKCPVLAGDCGDIPQSPRLQLVVVCCLNRSQCPPSHTFSPPGSRKRETSESILPNILFVPYPILVCASLGSECGHTGHRRTHGAWCTADSVGWCGMGCVCIAQCCTVWRMSGQEMTFDCIMSPLTTNTAGSSAAATWGQLLRRRGSG